MDPVMVMPDINEVIVYFVYGQVFFTLGLIVALQSRKHSRLALAHHLYWLAGFGIVHGLYEWGHAFIPLQAPHLSPDAVATLGIVRTLLLVLSFYLLLQFGTLIAFRPHKHKWVLRVFPIALLFAWFTVSVWSGAIVPEIGALQVRYPESTDLARLVLGFSGAALAAFGMIRQAHIVADMGLRSISWHFRWAALCLAVYAVVAGLIASRGESTLVILSNLPAITGIVAIPAPIMRSIAGLGIAFGVIRGLEVFQLEMDSFIAERHELRRNEDVRVHLFKRVIAAQEEERKRVARELHDEAGQSLSAVIMGLGAAAEALPRDKTKAEEILDDVRDLAVQTLAGVRQIILGLRPALLDDLGLAPALRRLAEDSSRRSSTKIEVYASGADGRLPPEVETVLFRILQEGMNNVAKHSKARRAELRLLRGESVIRAELEDDGIGFSPIEAISCLKSGRGLGLVGMRERASLVGGTVTIDSAPGAGTRLVVRVPLLERV